MKMQMLHALAAVLAHIAHYTIAIIAAQLLAQAGDHRKHMAQQCAILFGEGRRRLNVLFRDNQKMHRGLRVNVVKRKQLIVLCSPRESMIIKKYLADVDPSAFVTVMQVNTVWGEGRGFTDIEEEN